MSGGRVAGAAPVLVALTALAAPGALAQVDVEVEALENSILTSFTASGESIDDIVVWFEPDGATISEYATDPGWMIAESPESIRLYGSILEDGHTVKIGIKIQGEAPQIYWSASRDGAEVQWGLLLAPEPDAPEDTKQDTTQPSGDTGRGILDASEFRTIPGKPTPGSAIRLVGSGFGPLQELDLTIGGNRMEPLKTDAAGGFVTTRTVPGTLDGRVDFVLTDHMGADLQISLRLGETTEDAHSNGADLTIDGLDSTYHRGDRISVSGTATPLNSIVCDLYGPEGDIIAVKVVTADHTGAWSIPESIIIPLDAPLGRYSIQVNDGDHTLETGWTVESGKVIMLEPVRAIFQPGDTIEFNGTATPGEIIYLILQGPAGDELALDSWTVGSDGVVWWEFATSTSLRKGTYTLIASQGTEREFVYAGLGSAVEMPTVISFDKVNYLSSETPNIVIAGTPGDEINILVLDDTDTVVHRGNATLQADGRAVYNLDISTFSSGVYTAIAQRGTVQDNHEFGVGLSVGASTLDISTRVDHKPGDPVLVLGTTSSNVILTITLMDPDGNVVQRVETLADKTGMLTEQRLRIPLDAESGTWTVRAASGPNSDVAELFVLDQTADGLAVRVDDSGDQPMIVVSGASQVYVTVTISEGDRLVSQQRAYVTSGGTGQLPWNISIPGQYTITAEAGSETVSTTYRYDR